MHIEFLKPNRKNSVVNCLSLDLLNCIYISQVQKIKVVIFPFIHIHIIISLQFLAVCSP